MLRHFTLTVCLFLGGDVSLLAETSYDSCLFSSLSHMTAATYGNDWPKSPQAVKALLMAISDAKLIADDISPEAMTSLTQAINHIEAETALQYLAALTLLDRRVRTQAIADLGDSLKGIDQSSAAPILRSFFDRLQQDPKSYQFDTLYDLVGADHQTLVELAKTVWRVDRLEFPAIDTLASSRLPDPAIDEELKKYIDTPKQTYETAGANDDSIWIQGVAEVGLLQRELYLNRPVRQSRFDGVMRGLFMATQDEGIESAFTHVVMRIVETAIDHPRVFSHRPELKGLLVEMRTLCKTSTSWLDDFLAEMIRENDHVVKQFVFRYQMQGAAIQRALLSQP